MTARADVPLLQVNDWWQLPSGRSVVIRDVKGAGPGAEAVVRYIDQHGAMSVTDFELSVVFILRGRKVGRHA